MWGYTSSDIYAVKFLFYYLKHNVDYFRNAGDGRSSFSQISLPVTEEYKIPLLSSKEQQAIASVLSDFDEHIDNLSELIEKKKAIREGALDDLISGRTRVDGFDGDWIESTIESSTSAIITGGTPSTTIDKYWGGTIPWLASTEVHQKIITKATRNITEIGLNNSSAKIAPKDSVLIALAGQGKTRGTAAFLAYPMALNQSLAALVPSDKTNPKFLYYLIENMYLDLREHSSGDGGRGGLNKTLIKNINIRLPREIKEQQAIAEVLTAMDEEIESLETEKEKMIQIKEGAMDDLLTGRVRLKV
ncbi:TPA: restriction endonuclease subunit S [Listeria innocua]|nr:restriction endonuclease subunit S [Listeria innocua]